MIWLQSFPLFSFCSASCQVTLHLQTVPIVQILPLIDAILRLTLPPKQIQVWREILFFKCKSSPEGFFPNPQSWYPIDYSISLSSYQLRYWISVCHSSVSACPPETALSAKWVLVCLTSSYSHSANSWRWSASPLGIPKYFFFFFK